jgi:tetratricopeptide (TPR) repeat protein
LYISNTRAESQEEIISHARQVLATIPAGDPGRLLQSSSLRNLLARKCRATNSKADVDQAIDAAETATRAVQEMLAHLTKVWFSLGVLVARRCKLDDYRNVGDLDYAIECFDKAVDGLSEREFRGECLETLSELLFRRYEHTSDVNDAQRSVDTAERVLEFVAKGVAGRDLALVKLAVRLECLFNATRDVKLLDRAMLLVDEAMGVLSNNSLEHIRYEAEFASLLLRKYEASMDIKYLNQGIEACDKLWHVAEKGETDCSKYWAIVGQLLRHRYERTELKEDIDRAVYATKKALRSLTPRHPDYPGILGNLATVLASKFDCDRVREDLDSAIDLARKSVQMTLDGNAWKPLQLSRLSRLLAIRNDDGDVDQCVFFAEQACRDGSTTWRSAATLLSLSTYGRGLHSQSLLPKTSAEPLQK